MDWTKVNSMQIDLTSYCNARCGACTRNVNGGDPIEGLTLHHFDIDVWTRLFVEDLKDIKLTNIIFNGMWGDPAMHPQLPEMIKILYDSHPEVMITSLATNGGTHTPEYWARLGEALKPFKYHRVDFAIDGLEDTHEVYRRRVKYDRLMANVDAFLANGGTANWIMTVFDHNRHQVEEARKLAEQKGFAGFRSRKSNASHIYVNDKDDEYYITTDAVKKSDYVVDSFKDNAYIEPSALNTGCPWYNQLRVQLDPWHKVWPCCHVASHVIADQWVKIRDEKTGEKIKVKEFDMHKEVFLQVDDPGFNDLTNNSFNAIVNHKWYQEYLTNKIKNKSLLVCDRNCDIRNNEAKYNV